MNNKYNIIVTSRECRGNVDKMIKKFSKKMKKSGIIEEVRKNKHHTKASVAKREKRERAERQRIRDERKQKKARERRNRNN